jgi:diguanylate cyclase (GGDEF)-like protein/PAS domain S-box-containing protein
MRAFVDLNDRSLAELLGALRRETLDSDDPGRVIQELQVHQIELELQNRELRAAQQALEESRDRYADLYDFAPVAYARLTRQGQITQMNLTATQLLGVERGRVPEPYLGTRLAPGDGRVLLASLSRVLDGGEEEMIEVRLGRAPGPHRDLRLVVHAERPLGEAPPGCRVALFDITDLKQAQAAVVEQQRFLQSIIDGVADPILVVGTDGRDLLRNEAARVATDALVGEAAELTRHDDARDRRDTHHSPVQEVLANKTTVKAIRRQRGADGQTRMIELMVSPLRGPQGEILGAIESTRDVTAHLALAQQLQERGELLEHRACHDNLTGLPNRTLLAERLGLALDRAHREGLTLALLFLDLDHFKTINDSLGHSVGDAVLRQAAQRMRGATRSGDMVARLGGDEFLILLEGLQHGREDAEQVAEKLVRAFQQPFEVGARSLSVTTSIGISLYPWDGSDVNTLISNADAAMYLAKRKGHDTFQFHTDDMRLRASAHVSLAASLRQAVAREEFVLYYQPQHDLDSGRIVGLEALIRWRHPMLGPIGPEHFIALAEATDLIVPIGTWVLRAAAVQMQAWRRQGLLADVPVWVNLSNRDMQDPDLAESVGALMGEVDLERGALAVEITETGTMANPAVTAETIRCLRALGVEVAIDDFGVGYSSLSALKCLGVSEIKIDQSFVADLPGDADACAIARAIIALGRALGLGVVAEGVETRAQAEFLRGEGCRIGQGYLFSGPIPAAEFEAYVRCQAGPGSWPPNGTA